MHKLLQYHYQRFFFLNRQLLSSLRLDNAPPVPDSQTVFYSLGGLQRGLTIPAFCCTSITNCTKTTRNQILCQAAVACSW